MAKNLGTLRLSVRSFLGMRPSDLERLPPDVVDDLINANQRELCREYDFRFLEDLWQPTITPSTEGTSLPSNFSRMISLQYMVGAAKVHPSPLAFPTFRETYPLYPSATTSDTIKHYTIYGNQLLVAPRLASATTINVYFLKRLTDLSGDSDTNDLLDIGWDVLLWKVLLDAVAYGFEDPRLQMFQARYSAALNRLIVEQARSRFQMVQPQSREQG